MEAEAQKKSLSLLHVSLQKKIKLGYVNWWYEISSDFQPHNISLVNIWHDIPHLEVLDWLDLGTKPEKVVNHSVPHQSDIVTSEVGGREKFLF